MLLVAVKGVAGLFKAKRLQFIRCSPSIGPMSKTPTPSKLTKAQIREGLDTVPVSHILGRGAARELTSAQKTFALEVAKGSTGAAAYRKAYNTRGKKLTQANEASRLKGRPDIAAEIEAYQLAIEGAKHRNPAALRELVIQSLVKVIIDPDAKPGQITAAAKVLGTVTEVAAFTERKEVRTITSSEDARAAIMAQLKQLSNASAEDATIIDAQAEDLMRELAGAETHPTPTPRLHDSESLTSMHTIPHEPDPLFPNSAASPTTDLPENFGGETPPPSIQETPPSSLESDPPGGILLKK